MCLQLLIMDNVSDVDGPHTSMHIVVFLFFFQAEDGIRDLVRSRGLGDVYKRQPIDEVLLVLDATTGQNGLEQARVFADVVDVTGIVLSLIHI